MLTQPQINKIKKYPGLGWITALTSAAIRNLVAGGALQRSLFDTRNLAEISSPDYPGERLMACHNPLSEEERKRKRQELLKATDKGLAKIAQEVARRTKKPMKEAEIALKVGRVLGRCKMGKHYTYKIEAGIFQWARCQESIERDAQLDGIYVLRTSESQEQLSAEYSLYRSGTSS